LKDLKPKTKKTKTETKILNHAKYMNKANSIIVFTLTSDRRTGDNKYQMATDIHGESAKIQDYSLKIILWVLERSF